jgi:ABC-type nitrate/sulfonate/bicarbonate transport system permease component
MYAGLLVSALLGFARSILFDVLKRVLIPWKPR